MDPLLGEFYPFNGISLEIGQYTPKWVILFPLFIPRTPLNP